MFYSVSLFSQAPLACGSRALPSVLFASVNVLMLNFLYLCLKQLPLCGKDMLCGFFSIGSAVDLRNALGRAQGFLEDVTSSIKS